MAVLLVGEAYTYESAAPLMVAHRAKGFLLRPRQRGSDWVVTGPGETGMEPAGSLTRRPSTGATLTGPTYQSHEGGRPRAPRSPTGSTGRPKKVSGSAQASAPYHPYLMNCSIDIVEHMASSNGHHAGGSAKGDELNKIEQHRREVAYLMMAHFTYREMAEKLGVASSTSPRT